MENEMETLGPFKGVYIYIGIHGISMLNGRQSGNYRDYRGYIRGYIYIHM